MDVAALESHFGVQLDPGVACGPGTLLSLKSGSGISCGSLRAVLADSDASLWAHGFALVSGSGTKVAGFPQKVRADRFGKVANVDYTTFGPGQIVYLSNSPGQYSSGGGGDGTLQRVGFAIGCNEVFVDLDMQLGDRTS